MIARPSHHRRVVSTTPPAPLALLLLSLSTASSLPGEGWRARDRFAAFRFECSWPAASASSASDVQARRAFAVAMRDYADELSAFGWAQLSHNGSAGASVVGEFRGTPSTAPLFRAKLERGPAAAAAAASTAGHRRRGSTGSSSTKPSPPPRGYHVSVRDYEDTRIHLHFATFLLLDDARETCFEDGPPHACPAAASAVGEGGGARGVGAARAREDAGADESVNVGAGADESAGGGAALDGTSGSGAAEPDL
jgi:hypothetical protein